MSVGRRSLLVLLLFVSASAACSKGSLTQIVVVVNSDWDGFDRVTIDVAGFTKKNSLDVLLTKKLPRRVALVHDGGPLGPLSVTVSAYAKGMPDDPVLVETRSKIFFVDGQTRMLEIDLPYQCIGHGPCDTGQTCILRSTGATCASSDGASTLMPWTGDVSAIVKYHVKNGDVLGAGGSSAGGADGAVLSDSGPGRPHPDGGPSSDASAPALDAGQHDAGAGHDAGRDAGKTAVDSGPGALFPYAPSNFNPTNGAIASLARVAVTLNCGGTSEFNSTDRTFSGWCGMQPESMVIKQLDGTTDAVVLVMSALEVASGSSLKLTGSLPVILAVTGDVRIDGSVDASASGATPGPGADIGCGSASSLTGPTAQSFYGAGGGGGGGFGSAGGAGGIRQGGTGVSGEGVSGNAALVPLRGGCSGGRGGVTSGSNPAPAGGAGGGAVQISAAGMLHVTGTINAAGGGGAAEPSSQFGGGGGGSGGGSGGGILLEGSSVVMDAAAVISANGGSGAAGQSTSTSGKPGEDGLAGTAPAVGGKAGSTAGDGGAGGALTSAAAAGGDPSYVTSGGGGGGGGVGRIRVEQASSCALPGMLSPAASIVCPSCGGVCP